MSTTITTILIAILTYVIVTPLLDKQKINAQFHVTFNWRQELYELSHVPINSPSQLYQLKALVSPLNEDPEDCAINTICDYLLDGHTSQISQYSFRLQKLSRLLLKLNWLKHGSGQHLKLPVTLHLFPHYFQKNEFSRKIRINMVTMVNEMVSCNYKITVPESNTSLSLKGLFRLSLLNTSMWMTIILFFTFLYNTASASNSQLTTRFLFLQTRLPFSWDWLAVVLLFLILFIISLVVYIYDYVHIPKTDLN